MHWCSDGYVDTFAPRNFRSHGESKVSSRRSFFVALISNKDASTNQQTNLRIEGASTTIYEGPIHSGPRNITTRSGGTHLCDGTNNGVNPSPGNTPTDALDAAAKKHHFTFDGTYYTTFQDFSITAIGPDAQTATQFWGLLVNYQFTPVGGCQDQTKPDDNVLWAFDAFSKVYFLKAEPNSKEVKKGSSLVVTVTDGLSGVPVSGATIGGQVTDATGSATLTFPHSGTFEYKAERSDSLRSNSIKVHVA